MFLVAQAQRGRKMVYSDLPSLPALSDGEAPYSSSGCRTTRSICEMLHGYDGNAIVRGFKYLVHGRCSSSAYPEFRKLRRQTGDAIATWIFEDILC